MKVLEKISGAIVKTFTIWILLFSGIAYMYPKHFTWIGPYVVLLLGIVMFGMGLTLSVDNFKEVFRRPKDVILGVVGHYVLMPGIAFLLAFSLGLPKEIAVGVILVGCCPSGTASNVMVFLAKGDVALAVAIASVSTLLAPIVMPLLILLLASKWVAISFSGLFITIVQVVIIPLALGLIIKFFFGKQAEASTKVLPLLSVIAIVLIIAGVVAGSQAKLAQYGLSILGVVALHNLLGFFFGYFFGKMFGMDISKRKAVALEVGMQNSGLGVTLAMANFSPLTAVPSAIFSVWHNISGSILASIFSRMKESQSQTPLNSPKKLA